MKKIYCDIHCQKAKIPSSRKSTACVTFPSKSKTATYGTVSCFLVAPNIQAAPTYDFDEFSKKAKPHEIENMLVFGDPPVSFIIKRYISYSQ